MADYDFNSLLKISPEDRPGIESPKSLDEMLGGRRVVGIAGEHIKKGDTILIPLNGRSFSNKIFRV